MAKLILRQGEVFPDYIEAIRKVFEAAKVNPGCDTECAYDYCHDFGGEFFDIDCLNTTGGCTFNDTAINEAISDLSNPTYITKINNISADFRKTFRESINTIVDEYA